MVKEIIDWKNRKEEEVDFDSTKGKLKFCGLEILEAVADSCFVIGAIVIATKTCDHIVDFITRKRR